MNPIEKMLWRWQGKRKLTSDKGALRYTAISKLGEIANPADFQLLLDQLESNYKIITNAVAIAIRQLIEGVEDPQIETDMEALIFEEFKKSSHLSRKLALIEVMRALSLSFREKTLAMLISESHNDLQYAIIKSIEDTINLDILDDVLEASNTLDLVLRRIALQTWYEGVAKQPLKSVQEYITPRLHYLVRAAYELQTDGELLRRALSFANQKDLPHPKAYPDFMIRYITELLGTWEYDPEAFRSLHAIMVPSYFTFEAVSDDEEEPYIIL